LNWRKSYLIKILCLLLLCAACTRTPGISGDEIRIGELVSLSGTDGSYGQSSHRGVTLFMEELNASGGLTITADGKKRQFQVDMITRDNQSNKETTVESVKKLIHSDNVLAIIGEVTSERTKLAAPYAQKARIPMITPASTNPSVTEVGDHIFRACYVDPFQGAVMAKFARQNLNLSRVAVLKDFRSNYSTGLSEYFIDTFIELGGEIVAEESYSSTDMNFQDPLRALKLAEPEAIFIPGYYTQVVELAKLIRKQKVRARGTGTPSLLLGGDGWDNPELSNRGGGKSIRGGYYTNHFTTASEDPHVREFIKKYTDRFGEAPDGMAAMGYDAAGITMSAVAAALQKANQTTSSGSPTARFSFNGIFKYFQRKPNVDLRGLVREKIAKTKNFTGVTGRISLNSRRDAVKPIVILKVADPAPAYVTSIDP
jgi:branched-chain amino acid transport system substrate-binding protein